MSKKQILLTYDTDTGCIEDHNGMPIIYWNFCGDLPEHREVTNKTDSLDTLTKLRSMNLSVADIRELKDIGVI